MIIAPTIEASPIMRTDQVVKLSANVSLDQESEIERAHHRADGIWSWPMLPSAISPDLGSTVMVTVTGSDKDQPSFAL